MQLKTNLPDSITLANGTVLYPVIGGHVAGRPFLTPENSGVDVTKNGWATDLLGSVDDLVVSVAKRQGLKYRRIGVLSRNLRGKSDLHRQTYQPTKWVFVEVRRFRVERNCCLSGNCIKCISARRVDPSMKRFQPIRVTQLDNLSREKAELVARNFAAYKSEVLIDTI